MELVVYNIKGEKTAKTVTLNESIFDVTPNDHAIYLDTKQYLANQRQGTHASLEKSTVSGSTKKLKKQKGTGGARAGSRKSPLFRGGARAFGPQPRDYSFKLNKKLKKLARLSALKLDGRKTLMVLPENIQNIVLSSRNLKRAKVTRACDLNTYDILNAQNLIFLESSVTEVEKSFEN